MHFAGVEEAGHASVPEEATSDSGTAAGAQEDAAAPVDTVGSVAAEQPDESAVRRALLYLQIAVTFISLFHSGIELLETIFVKW